ncbi:MAG: hypothetical protein ABIA76_06035 [Candidatus Diapherotrites archaeon]
MAEVEDLRKKLMQLTKKGMRESYSSSEVHIIRATALIESLDEVINLLTEQLREWHAVHFPELNQLIKSNDSFVELTAKLTERNRFDLINVMALVQDTVLAERIIEKAKDSAGEETDKLTLNEMKSFAEKILELKKEKKKLNELIEKIMKEKWPHVTEITGALLGAKMIAKIGSAKKFAFAPSSTIQLIGAEKALFLHLKKGTKTPKHGFLYIHPEIIKAGRKEKGKNARQLAGKISIAAKQDFFARKNAEEIIEQDTKSAEKEKQDYEKRKEEKKFEKFGSTPKNYPKFRNDLKEKRKFHSFRKFGNKNFKKFKK